MRGEHARRMTPGLVTSGVTLLHIRGDGRVAPEEDLHEDPEQLPLL
ncbi:MAG: hypothetical protein QF464_19005 [Myxococcota bacterium]|nr:hypothetical protein [Myxococcota bacterium]